ncbi:uncharacterized protein DEA37_0007185 [Paragonimus westermani]|uniref:Uncharacterized protein n=1 Tax=Paragonimus westermani TaxID=34504 RepID=A0A5J4NNG2_9TREM|nr:uncharacterized protein DEA37_0007185 [Paragonimus westermani]
MRAAAALLVYWIPANGRLCAVRFSGSVKTSSRRKTFVDIIIIIAYAPTDCSDAGLKDDFYSYQAVLLRSSHDYDIVVPVEYVDVQVDRLDDDESLLSQVAGPSFENYRKDGISCSPLGAVHNAERGLSTTDNVNLRLF